MYDYSILVGILFGSLVGLLAHGMCIMIMTLPVFICFTKAAGAFEPEFCKAFLNAALA